MMKIPYEQILEVRTQNHQEYLSGFIIKDINFNADQS